jgi:hypothetical protein
LNEPLWLRVTFAATKSTFELSGEIASVSAPAGLLELVSGAAFETDAFGLFAAGSAQLQFRTAMNASAVSNE